MAPEIATLVPCSDTPFSLAAFRRRSAMGGDERQEGRRMLLRHCQHHVGVEPGEQHEPRPHRHREGEAQRQPVGVEHRQHRVDDAPVAPHDRRHPRARLGGIREQVAVRQRCALRRAGRAARVLDQRRDRRSPAWGGLREGAPCEVISSHGIVPATSSSARHATPAPSRSEAAEPDGSRTAASPW